MKRTAFPRVRYLRTSDGVQLAWAAHGSGPPLIRTGGWLTHLEYDFNSPVWRHWTDFFSEHFTFVRYDERGCGMTDWDTANTSTARWVEDLEHVVAAAGIEEPFQLLGTAHGAAICVAYAARHPGRVSKLVLYGGFAQGWASRGDPIGLRQYEAIIEVVAAGWSKVNPAFRRLFTSRFIPGASEQQITWFNDFCMKATSPGNAAALLKARGLLDVTDLLGRIEAPTLVVHARGDETVPITQGRLLAAAIPNAEFVQVDSSNHILLEHEEAWTRFQQVVLEFTGVGRPEPASGAFASLSPREREILLLVTEGLGNVEIAERLSISDKTVRNHVSNLYDKLGVWTRAQAIVFAHDHGFLRDARGHTKPT